MASRPLPIYKVLIGARIQEGDDIMPIDLRGECDEHLGEIGQNGALCHAGRSRVAPCTRTSQLRFGPVSPESAPLPARYRCMVAPPLSRVPDRLTFLRPQRLQRPPRAVRMSRKPPPHRIQP